MLRPSNARTTSTNREAETSTSLKDKGIFLLSGDFNSKLATSVITWIFEANLVENRSYDHLTLVINSHGGETDSAFAIIDVMRGSNIPVHTIGIGGIMSSGLLTFMAGEKGHRILTPNTSILSHQFAWGSYGKEHELLSRVVEFNNTSNRIIRHYQDCTGLSEQDIKDKLLPAHDVWLTAEEAIQYNLADEIRMVRT